MRSIGWKMVGGWYGGLENLNLTTNKCGNEVDEQTAGGINPASTQKISREPLYRGGNTELPSKRRFLTSLP